MDFFDQTCKNRPKTEKENITIEFYIFEIVSVQNFGFWISNLINPFMTEAIII